MKRLRAIAVALAVGGVAAFLLPGRSHGAAPRCDYSQCRVYLTASGPSPAMLTKNLQQDVAFTSADGMSHTVVFANGLCSITVSTAMTLCHNRSFMNVVGKYAYIVDGTHGGAVVTRPFSRSVTLTAGTHTIRSSTLLRLHGRVTEYIVGGPAPPPRVLIFARHAKAKPFKPLIEVRTELVLRCYASCPDPGPSRANYRWKLSVRPDVTTTYVAKVTTQRLCYVPAKRCAHPHGQVWANAKSRPFTVRIRH